MKKVYGYIRVSTTKQGEGASLQAQKEAITKYAAQHDLEIIEWFEEKETAAKQGRPFFNQIIKQLKEKKADGLIIHKIDRGARNYKDWVDIDELIGLGYEVHFAHESLDMRTRAGRLAADIQIAVAVDYIRNLSQEASKGLNMRLEQGIYPFHAPTGYLNAGKGKLKPIDPIQAPLVKKTFELYATRKYSLRTLRKRTYDLGLRNIKEKKLSINSLSILLNNPFYMGIIRVKGKTYKGHHEPIISPALFKQVQSVLKGKDNQKSYKHTFTFSKLIRCKQCGYILIAEKQKGHTYYRCHTSGCVTKGLREKSIENSLLTIFNALQLRHSEMQSLRAAVKEIKDNWQSKQQELLFNIKMQKGQIQQKLERLTDCYIEGGLDKLTFENRKNQLLVDIVQTETNEKELEQQNDRKLDAVENFLELAKDIKNTYILGSLEQKREIVKNITSNLNVEGKKLLVSMYSPFETLSERFLSYRVHMNGAAVEKRVYVIDIENPLLPLNPNYRPSKKKLRLILDRILDTICELPECHKQTE